MIVVGGTYHLDVTVPGRADLDGSGLRAAAALRTTNPQLVSAIEADHSALAATTAATLGISARYLNRDRPVRFRYDTPMSVPVVDGLGARLAADLSVDDDTVLLFGMVEDVEDELLSISAQHVVFDPQRPHMPRNPPRQQINSDHFAIVANAREIRQLAGNLHNDPGLAAQHFLTTDKDIDVIVVKDSARGCLVARPGTDIVRVGPYPTSTVWPLGSGDVFTAGFAHAWSHGADAVEAARVGSTSAAWWCGTKNTVIPADILAGKHPKVLTSQVGTELSPTQRPPRIYLAAPFFTAAEVLLVELCRTALIGLGASVFSPLHDVGRGNDEVAAADLAGLDNCDGVLALLDGWDPGTVYETGWAHHKGLPVVGFVAQFHGPGTKMLVGSGAELHQDLSSALYRAVWAAMGHPLNPGRIEGPHR